MKERINDIIHDTINAIDEYERKIDEINSKNAKKERYLTILVAAGLVLFTLVLIIIVFTQFNSKASL